MADQYFLIDWPYHHGNHHLAHYLWPFIIKAIKPCVCVYVCELLPPLEKEKRTPAVCKLCSRNHNAEFSRGRHFLFNTPRLHVLLVRRDVRGPGKNRCSHPDVYSRWRTPLSAHCLLLGRDFSGGRALLTKGWCHIPTHQSDVNNLEILISWQLLGCSLVLPGRRRCQSMLDQTTQS